MRLYTESELIRSGTVGLPSTFLITWFSKISLTFQQMNGIANFLFEIIEEAGVNFSFFSSIQAGSICHHRLYFL